MEEDNTASRIEASRTQDHDDNDDDWGHWRAEGPSNQGDLFADPEPKGKGKSSKSIPPMRSAALKAKSCGKNKNKQPDVKGSTGSNRDTASDQQNYQWWQRRWEGQDSDRNESWYDRSQGQGRKGKAAKSKNPDWHDRSTGTWQQERKGKGKGKGKSKGKDEGKATTSASASSGLTEAPNVSSGDTVRPDEVGGSTAERKLSENRNLAQALNIDTAQDTAAEYPPWARITKSLKKRYERYWEREQRLKYGGDAWQDWGNPNWQAIDPDNAREFKAADGHTQVEHHNQRPPPFDAQNLPLSEYLQKLRRNAETEITHYDASKVEFMKTQITNWAKDIRNDQFAFELMSKEEAEHDVAREVKHERLALIESRLADTRRAYKEAEEKLAKQKTK